MKWVTLLPHFSFWTREDGVARLVPTSHNPPKCLVFPLSTLALRLRSQSFLSPLVNFSSFGMCFKDAFTLTLVLPPLHFSHNLFKMPCVSALNPCTAIALSILPRASCEFFLFGMCFKDAFTLTLVRAHTFNTRITWLEWQPLFLNGTIEVTPAFLAYPKQRHGTIERNLTPSVHESL